MISRKLIWDKQIPLKISIFMWRLLNLTLPFPKILRPFGFYLPSKCPFCESGDSISHGFVGCQVAAWVWKKMERVLGICTLPADDVAIKLQSWWSHSFGHSLKAEIAQIVPLYMLEAMESKKQGYFQGLQHDS